MEPIFLQLIPYFPTTISSETYVPFVSNTAAEERQQCNSSGGNTNIATQMLLKIFLTTTIEFGF